jgi:hypothetical protein
MMVTTKPSVLVEHPPITRKARLRRLSAANGPLPDHEIDLSLFRARYETEITWMRTGGKLRMVSVQRTSTSSTSEAEELQLNL